MLKADARRRSCAKPATGSNMLGRISPRKPACFPFARILRLHGEGVAAIRPRLVRPRPSPANIGRALDVSQSLDRIRVPALHVSGWYDTLSQGQHRWLSRAHALRGQRLSRANNQYLVAGPWIHIPWGDRIGAADFGADALLDTDAILLRWFNHWLKDSGEFAERAAHSPFRARGKSLAASRRVGPPTRNHALYLHSAGKANSRKGDGALSHGAARRRRTARHFCLRSGSSGARPGRTRRGKRAFDQATLELGNNFLVYTTEPLAEPLRIFGTPRVSLYCCDFVRAYRLHRQARSRASRTARRNSSASASRARVGFSPKPDTPRTKFISGNSISNPPRAAFAAGDRIRLEIASSAFPLYDRNPGSGRAVLPRHFLGLAALDANSSITTASIPSALYLPVERGARNERRGRPCPQIEFTGVSKRYGNGRHGPRRRSI